MRGMCATTDLPEDESLWIWERLERLCESYDELGGLEGDVQLHVAGTIVRTTYIEFGDVRCAGSCWGILIDSHGSKLKMQNVRQFMFRGEGLKGSKMALDEESLLQSRTKNLAII